ncbi:MAG: hypothetical protein COT18_10340 [Elusimicrobia bacterium CG08_land_8_20_14_0_20_59_10]|nr:MAG: hypothetical protein COT18_10340 [Elusimicrobia bacterium CG08_land_8_20_14_0_20_59_10]
MRWLEFMTPTRLILKTSAAALLLAALGADAGAGGLSRLNPAFFQYTAPAVSTSTARAKAGAAPAHSFGLRPSPIDRSHLAGRDISAAIAGKPGFLRPGARTFAGPGDAAYDLRTDSRLTAVRDQGSYQNCWAYATYASMESNLLTGETWDFSEYRLATDSGFDWGIMDGGVSDMSAAYLTRWSGPVNEGESSPVRKHLQGMYWIPRPEIPNEAAFKTNVKTAIYNDGAVYSSVFWDANATPGATDTYFYNTDCTEPYGVQGACTCSGGTCGGHAIALVGWDDDVPKSYFTTPTMGTPAGNGAFLARNSWGTDTGVGGYFYISYYDTSLGGDTASFNGIEATSNYTTLYQYDDLGYTYPVGNGDIAGPGGDSTTEWMANIFNAVPGNLQAVGFYTTDMNVSYQLYVYTGVTAGSPRSGTLAHSGSGVLAASGYHTISLGGNIMVTSGSKFSVVVKLVNSSYVYPLAVEFPIADYSSGASASAGQSYISRYGSLWTDLTTVTDSYYHDNFHQTNVCLKAYAATDATPPAAVAAVYDGSVTGSDINNTGSTTQLSANWPASSDPETGISGYAYAIGTISGTADVVGWTPNGTGLSVTKAGLSLVHGTTYYFGVKAANGVGTYSAETWSDGQEVDTSLPPEVAYVSDGTGVDIDYVSSLNTLSANWGETTGADSYEYAIGSTAGGTNIVNWTSVGTARSVTRTGLTTLIEGSTYYFSVKAYRGIIPSVAAVSDGQRVDITSPTARITLTSGQPAVSSVTLAVSLFLEEATGVYSSSPSLTFTTYGGGQTAALSRESVFGSTWTFTGHIETWYSTGTAAFSFSATDMAGNLGTTVLAGGTGSTFMLDTALSGASGGYAANSDTMAVTIPAGAYSGSLYVHITTVAAARSAAADAAAATSLKPLTIDLSREFTASTPAGAPITAFSLPVTLTMSYPDLDGDGRIDGDYLTETQARIYYLDEAQGKWAPVVDGFVRDTAANTLSARVNHFSVYSVRVQAEEQNSLNMKAYPNPCDFRRHSLTMTGIPLDATNVKVYIYNPAAELVRTLTAGDGVNALNEVAWDGKLRGGAKAASGLYIYLVKTAAHGKAGGKFFGMW